MIAFFFLHQMSFINSLFVLWLLSTFTYFILTNLIGSSKIKWWHLHISNIFSFYLFGFNIFEIQTNKKPLWNKGMNESMNEIFNWRELIPKDCF